jgi:glutathione synthase/RimK-type ligase-like ATP-grasp enzyme
MKINICYRESTSETARRLSIDLAEYLKCSIELNQCAIEDAFNISWGYQGEEKFKYLNPPELIKQNIDKLQTNHKLEKAGCPVIKAYDKHNVLRAYKTRRLKTPILARFKTTQGGFGMRTCLCKYQIQKAIIDGYEMFKEYIKPKAEYRVNVFKGRPILIVKKDYENPEYIGRNNETERVVRKYPKSILKMSIKAVSVIGLDFGAVDILQSEDNKLYILEVNSAPSLNKKMRKPYMREIKKILKNEKMI